MSRLDRLAARYAAAADCGNGKVPHQTWLAAWREAVRMNVERNGVNPELVHVAYRCTRCRAFHVGRR